jgi:hypothetical protein
VAVHWLAEAPVRRSKGGTLPDGSGGVERGGLG